MRLSDKMKARRADLIERMETLSKAAAEADRLFTPDEQRAWDDTKAEVAKLDVDLKSVLDREDFSRRDRPAAPVLLDERGDPLTVLRGGANMDRLVARHRGVSAELMAEFSIGHICRGVALGDWGKRTVLQKAMNEATGASGQFTVPAPLSAAWLDMARAVSVCGTAGAITIPMTSQTLRIAGLATDVAPTFRAELTDFPISNNTFRAIDLRARSIGVISEMGIELLADSPNASQMVETSMLAAMGLAFDAALLKGDGVVVSPADNPTGIWIWPGVVATTAVGTPADFKPWLGAMQALANANHVPATVIDHPNTFYHLAGLATGIPSDKSPLTAPAPYATMQKLQTTAMPTGGSLVGDFTKAGWGMREGIVIEASRVSGDSLTKGKVQIRCMARLDTFVLYAAAFHKLTGITYV